MLQSEMSKHFEYHLYDVRMTNLKESKILLAFGQYSYLV